MKNKCPSDFISFQENCLYISNYETNWYEAKNACEKFDANLLIIKSPIILDFTSQLFNEFNLGSYYWVNKE